MIDNFEKIKPLLKFRSEDDFYFIQILQRKKDAKEGQKIVGPSNNSRLVKAYYVKSLAYLENVEEEIKKLCVLFNARAGINLNRRSYKKMHLLHLKRLTDQLLNDQFHFSHKAYSSVVGAHNHESDKTWIIDLDEEDFMNSNIDLDIIEFINTQCKPKGNKYIQSLKSKSGKHLITSPFDLSEFKKKFPEIEVHKNNPTNIYIP